MGTTSGWETPKPLVCAQSDMFCMLLDGKKTMMSAEGSMVLAYIILRFRSVLKPLTVLDIGCRSLGRQASKVPAGIRRPKEMLQLRRDRG